MFLRSRFATLIVFSLLALVAVVACSSSMKSDVEQGYYNLAPVGPLSAGTCTPDLPTIQKTVFVASCAQKECHNATDKASGLDLTSPDVGSSLIGAQSVCQGWEVVAPSAPEKSSLYEKIVGQPPCGANMPIFHAPLTTAQQECIKAWIAGLPAPATCDLTTTGTDPNNCGACGNVCPTNASCVDGACACPSGIGTNCGTACVDLQTSLTDCGNCGNACPKSATCTAGVCECSSAIPTACKGSCVDTKTNLSNCGACGNTCPTGAACTNGTCVCPTTASTVCGGACVDKNSDPMNCGGCGTVCPASAKYCVGGTCSSSCNLTSCPDGSCVDLTTNFNNCGTCGHMCASGQTCTNSMCTCPNGGTQCPMNTGPCVDTSTSFSNCGACGNVCPTGATCTGSKCVCPSGQTACNGACVDTTTSFSNCGTCGKVCGNGQSCVGGACVCPSGQIFCNGSCVASDTSHCGSCTNVCAPGQTCSNGTCSCGTSSVSFSGAVQPIFTNNCATSGCHIKGAGTNVAYLDLTTGDSYAQLVNHATTECTDGRFRVKPGDPPNSYLMQKLQGVNMCGSGTQMPKKGVSLSSADLTAISNWICGGALNN